jgi:ketosteroid isomerase-like protein
MLPSFGRDTAWAMSQENVELVRRSYQAFQRGDLDAAMERLAPNFVLIDPTRVDATEHYGRAGVDKWLAEWSSIWDDWRVVADRFVDAEPDVVMLGRQWGRGKGSGIEVEQPFGQVWTLQDGVFLRMRYFDHWDDALEAAGLRE